MSQQSRPPGYLPYLIQPPRQTKTVMTATNKTHDPTSTTKPGKQHQDLPTPVCVCESTTHVTSAIKMSTFFLSPSNSNTAPFCTFPFMTPPDGTVRGHAASTANIEPDEYMFSYKLSAYWDFEICIGQIFYEVLRELLFSHGENVKIKCFPTRLRV